MDRTYVTQQHKVPVFQLGLDLWRDHVVHNPTIQQVSGLHCSAGGTGPALGQQTVRRCGMGVAADCASMDAANERAEVLMGVCGERAGRVELAG